MKNFGIFLSLIVFSLRLFAQSNETVNIRDFEYDGITYTVINEEEKTCKTKDGNGYYESGNIVNGELVIPEIVSDGISEFTVTAIGNYSFSYNVDLTSVTIPATVTRIEPYAFWYCLSLRNVILPKSLAYIGDLAFSQCENLTDIDLPDNVTEIGAGAFWRCSELTNIIIPCSIQKIENMTFSQCTRLKSVIMPNSVTSIGRDAFALCVSLPEIEIPNSVKSIGHSAFKECTSLHEIKFPNSVKEIGAFAFGNCSSLTKIEISGSVESMEWAFLDCNNLMDIVVDENNPVFKSVDGVLFNKTMTTILQYPAGRKGEYAIPNTVETIYYRTFYNCTGLTNIVIPNSVRNIREWAFSYCTGLNTILLPTYLSTIQYASFYGCTGLKTINIPQYVDDIAGSAFVNCSNLTEIIVHTQNDKFRSIDGVLFNKQLSEILLYPNGKRGGYSIPNTVTIIGTDAFSNCSNLTSIEIPNSVVTIGNAAFAQCTGLTEIVIPNSVTLIDAIAFSGCSNLKSIIFGKSIESISYQAFYNSPNIRRIVSSNPEPPQLLMVPPKYPEDELDYNDVFDSEIYSTAELIVPEKAIETYRSADGWKDFQFISKAAILEFHYTDNSDATVFYDLHGRVITSPHKGEIILVRQGSKSKKMITF